MTLSELLTVWALKGYMTFSGPHSNNNGIQYNMAHLYINDKSINIVYKADLANEKHPITLLNILLKGTSKLGDPVFHTVSHTKALEKLQEFI